MGIRGLTKYVKEHKSVLFKEQAPVENARLVFDGDALYFTLIRRLTSLLLAYGGDYDTLYTEFLKFFETLKNLGIDIYVVINGGNNIEMKKEYIHKFRIEMIERVGLMNSLVLDRENPKEFDELPKPMFTSRLFEEVLLDARVKHVTVEDEVAPFLACLANQLDAFVVTNDSDLFLSDVKKGFITMDTFFNCFDNNLQHFPYYNRKNLADHLKLDERVLPVLAIVLGSNRNVNDYKMEAQAICGVSHRGSIASKINSIAEYLKKIFMRHRSIDITDTMDEILGEISNADNAIRQRFYKELMYFNTRSFAESSRCYQQILEHPKCIGDILEEVFENPLVYVKKLVIHGLIDSCVLDIARYSTHYVKIQTEYIRSEASSKHSGELRKSLYTMLKPPKSVLEHTRKGTEYKKEVVLIKRLTDFTLNSLLESTVQERREFIMNLLAFPASRKSQLFDINPEATLFLLSLQYFLEQFNSSLKIEIAKALLLTFIICKRNGEHHEDPKFQTLPQIDLGKLHLYCSFQSVLHYVMVINTLLGDAFQPMEIKRSLSGSKFQRILLDAEKGGSYLKDYISGEEELKDFEFQFQIVAPLIMPPTTHK